MEYLKFKLGHIQLEYGRSPAVPDQFVCREDALPLQLTYVDPVHELGLLK